MIADEMAPVKSSKRPTRKEQAAATRRKIVAAATTLFAERGYQATTMSDIARAAGVAVQTVHFVFHTKAALLNEAFETAVLGELGPPPHQPWFRALAHEPDGRKLLASLAENVAPIAERAAPLSRVIRAAPDEDAAAVWQRQEHLRRDGYQHMIGLLAADGRLRPDLDVKHATDILMFILGPDSHQILVSDYGWTTEQWKWWATDTLAQQLLATTQKVSRARPRKPS
jgi:AcrR family transcriptional regulator